MTRTMIRGISIVALKPNGRMEEVVTAYICQLDDEYEAIVSLAHPSDKSANGYGRGDSIGAALEEAMEEVGFQSSGSLHMVDELRLQELLSDVAKLRGFTGPRITVRHDIRYVADRAAEKH